MKNIIKSFGFWVPIISYTLFFVLMELSYIKLDIEWVKDFRVWINEYIITFITYLFSYVLCYKIKKLILREGISITIAVFVSNCFSFQYESAKFSVLEIIILAVQLVLILIIFILSTYSGYRKGQNEAIELQETLDKNLGKIVQNTKPKQKTLIYNCNRLIKKYPKEIAFLQEFGIEFVQKIIQKDKEIKRRKTNESDDQSENRKHTAGRSARRI